MRSMFRLAASTVLAVLPLAAQAQSAFPSKPIKFIVPFPAGGINDVLARIAADKLQAKWGQPIIIEQKTGAGGNIGADLRGPGRARRPHAVRRAARAAVDQPASTRSCPTSREDFVPITVLGAVPTSPS